MKKLVFILAPVIFLFACDIDSNRDCIRGGGKTETRDLAITDLEQITIGENIRLEISYSEEEGLEAVGGEHHLDQLEIIQNEKDYEFKISSLCPTGFSEAPVVLKLKSSTLNSVRNSSQFEVVSTTILKFPDLSLISEDSNNSDALSLGNFYIEVDNTRVNIVGNGISDFVMSGSTELLNFGTYSGSGTILARDLEADVVRVFHRSFRDAVVTPIQRLEGELRSTGNLISTKKPPQVEVEEFYEGRLIFE